MPKILRHLPSGTFLTLQRRHSGVKIVLSCHSLFYIERIEDHYHHRVGEEEHQDQLPASLGHRAPGPGQHGTTTGVGGSQLTELLTISHFECLSGYSTRPIHPLHVAGRMTKHGGTVAPLLCSPCTLLLIPTHTLSYPPRRAHVLSLLKLLLQNRSSVKKEQIFVNLYTDSNKKHPCFDGLRRFLQLVLFKGTKRKCPFSYRCTEHSI